MCKLHCGGVFRQALAHCAQRSEGRHGVGERINIVTKIQVTVTPLLEQLAVFVLVFQALRKETLEVQGQVLLGHIGVLLREEPHTKAVVLHGRTHADSEVLVEDRLSHKASHEGGAHAVVATKDETGAVSGPEDGVGVVPVAALEERLCQTIDQVLRGVGSALILESLDRPVPVLLRSGDQRLTKGALSVAVVR